MYQSGETRAAESATTLPTGFKYVIGASALFIAGCSAFFSVRGLGLLFVGSAVAVMIMASSLEVGKLVAASFLYRYWHHLNRPLKIYLTLAVLVLIGITSLGNYGYLARAYERTHSHVTMLEDQIAALEKEIADTQRQIDASRGALGKSTDASREDISKLQQRITEANTALEQSLARLQGRRQTAQDRRDRDIQVPTQQLAEKAEVLKKAIASEESAIAALDDRVAVLDRAVDAYTKQGGPGLFKIDSVKKGQELRAEQRRERDSIAAQITEAHARQEQLRADHAKVIAATDKDIAAVREQFAKETVQLDADEQELRKARDTAVAQAEQQLAAMQTQGKAITTGGDTQIEALYQRIRSRNDEIRHLREQIAGTDIGSYRFVARAFDAQADSVVKWLTLALVVVFDPLAVSLAVGFNVAMLGDRRRRISPLAVSANAPLQTEFVESAAAAPTASRRNRWLFAGTSALLLLLGIGALTIGAKWGMKSWQQQALAAHAAYIPGDSFAVIALHPAELQRSAPGQNLLAALGSSVGTNLADSLTQLLAGGVDPRADVYAFAKFPTRRAEDSSGERPNMLCGLVARVSDVKAAEATLSQMAERLSSVLRTNASALPPLTRSRAMIRFGQGRYMDPEGGFFTFGLTEHVAVVLLEFEGDPKSPNVENEIRLCLAPRETDGGTAAAAREPLPERALSRGGAFAVWFAADRFFANLPKNPAAQTRYQQLQNYLGFDLVLNVQPAGSDQLNVTADYAYQTDRFKDRQQPTAVQQLATLGSADAAGIAGRLMDRCADTLDYDSFIERLRVTLAGPKQKGVQDVIVEKSFGSARDARFVLVAHCDAQAGPPLVAALNTLWQ